MTSTTRNRASTKQGVLYISYDGMCDHIAESQVLPYVLGLAHRGWPMTLISHEKRNVTQQKRSEVAARLREAGVVWLPQRYWGGSPWGLLQHLSAEVLQSIKRSLGGRPMLIHARSYIPAATAMLLKRTLGIPMLFDMRGFWFDEKLDAGFWQQGPLYGTGKRIERVLFAHADAVVSLTHAARRELLRWPAIMAHNTPVHVIPTCLDLAPYALVSRKARAGTPPTLAYLGSFGARYLTNEMLQIFACVRKQAPAARLLIFASNAADDVLRACERHQVPPASVEVSTLAHTDVPRRLVEVDATFCLIKPGFAVKASCPTKFGESLAAGAPVVVNTGVGDCDTIAKEHRVGVVANLGQADAKRVATELLALLAEGELMRARCRQVAKATFDLRGALDTYEAIYHQLAPSQGQRPAGALGSRRKPVPTAGASDQRERQGADGSQCPPQVQKKKILIVCPYPHGAAPSQRFRFEQYIPMLQEHGFEVTQAPFLDLDTYKVLYQPGHTREKARGVLLGFLRRLWLLTGVKRYDYVFVHLEATPIGPPFVERALIALGCRVIYDIDDAIFIARTSAENKLINRFRFRSKVAWLAGKSHKVIAVNPYLLEWARQFNDQVFLVPTSIDPEYHRPPEHKRENPRTMLGWTGTHSTMVYLDLIRPALALLQEKFDFSLRVVCNRDPGFAELKHYEFIHWNQATEIEDLQPIDIGLMPVFDNDFSKGKVGFKAIQFSALGIPPVVSDVGSGREVVEDGRTGLVVPNTTEAWVSALSRLLAEPNLRRTMGKAAREHILSRYSIPAQSPNYLSLFQ